jgi:hypothetical protein
MDNGWTGGSVRRVNCGGGGREGKKDGRGIEGGENEKRRLGVRK